MVDCLFTSKFILIARILIVYFVHNTRPEAVLSNFDDSVLFRVRWLTKEVLEVSLTEYL